MQQLSKYKKTELGDIPEDWNLINLEDLSIRIMKGIFDLNPVNYVKEGIPFLRISDIKNNTIETATTKFISEDLNKKFPSSELHPGDLVISKVGSVGLSDKIAKIPNSISYCNISQNLIGIKLDTQKLSSNYLLSILQLPTYMSKVSSGSNTTTLKSIQLEVLRKLPIILPPLKEQQKIASILSNVDSLIQKTNQIIEQTRILKKGLMQRLLTKGIGHTKFKEEKLLFGKYEKIPMDWEIKKFDEVFEFLRAGTNSRDDLEETGDIQYIHYGDIHAKWDSVLDCDLEKIPWIDKNKVSGLPFLKEGDLIIADASEDYEGSGASVLLKNVRNRKIVSGLHTIPLRNINENIASDFKRYLNSIRFVKSQIVAYVTGISVYGLSKNNLRKVRIPLPPLKEQQKIASILSNVDSLIQKQQTDKSNLETLKKGLMQQLLTGKIRVKV